MIALTECTLETLDRYNAVEVLPIEEDYLWAVYLHLIEGELEWVADFSTQEKAEIFAQGIQFMLGAVIADKLIVTR